MKIEKDKVVKLVYTLKSNGEVVEEVPTDNPFVFLAGANGTIPAFEKNLTGLEAGAKFAFEIKSDDAYGPRVEEAVAKVPINVFEVDGEVKYDMLFEGNMLPMQDQEGMPMDGKVIEVSDEEVTLDFNHALAGHDLNFEGEVIEVRVAEKEELEHGHVHGEGGVSHTEEEVG